MAGFLQHKLDTKSFGSVPTAMGIMTRLACARLKEAGIEPEPLLSQAGLPVEQVRDRSARLSARHQISFLNIAADALDDQFLGFHIAQACDIRELGPLYYIPASSQSLGEGLRRASRYTSLVNESLSIQYVEGREIRIIFDYVGVARHSDRHQIESCLTILTRLCRHLTGQHLVPTHVRIAHSADRTFSKLIKYLGSQIEFNAKLDEVAFTAAVRDLPIMSADPYLNQFLITACEEAMARREKTQGTFKSKVGNAIAPLLPHGKTNIGLIARQLVMSQRTLARRLASEGLTFTELLETIREELARKYLSNRALSISQIAWLLGYREVSAFTHSFKRWTGRTPREARQQQVAWSST